MTKHSISRNEVIQVYEHCPRRPYVELTVPQDASTLLSVLFTTESRDQGWADDKSIPYTWFDIGLRRPEGRSDVADIRFHYNVAGQEEFAKRTTRWDVLRMNNPPRVEAWLRAVQPGDVIQLIPKAQYICWVNIIREGKIEVEYERREEAPESDDGLHQHRAELSKTDGTHPYKPLDHAKHQIRVLVIEPGQLGTEIAARFRYVDLADSGETPENTIKETTKSTTSFHALSYFWGNSSEKVSISILDSEGTKIASKIGISATLERAIRRLRSSATKPLCIWIDAVCINQEDLEERAQQVSMMGFIYSRAESVHVWLDDFVLGLDEALRLIRDIVNVNKRLCPGATLCKCSGTKHTLSTEQLDEITKHEGFHSFGNGREVFHRHRFLHNFSAAATAAGDGGLGDNDVHFTYFMQTFFHHPWFQRVWVVQEAILSPKTTVYSANEEIPWEELLMINKMASTPEYAGEARWSVQTRDSMPALWAALTESHGGGSLSILEVFVKALDLKATDPRDKLWGLLSFGHETKEATKIPPLLRPDYTKPLDKVMADFTRWWILEYRSLDILSYVHCQPTHAWRRTLWDLDPRLQLTTDSEGHYPTWALSTEGHAQWSHMTLQAQFPTLFGNIALTKTPPDLDLIRSSDCAPTYNPLLLPLRGKTLGTITALDHPPRNLVAPRPWEVDDRHKSLVAVFNRLFDPSARQGAWLLRGVNYHEEQWDPNVLTDILDRHIDAHWGYVVEEGVSQRVLMPPVLVDEHGDGDGGEGDEARGEGGEVEGGNEEADREENGRFMKDGEGSDGWEESNLPACVEKCFFLLDGGKMYGLCPWTARKGDVVVLLQGGGVPYLLRPFGDAREGKYQFVGECFVQLNTGLRRAAQDESGKEVFVLV